MYVKVAPFAFVLSTEFSWIECRSWPRQLYLSETKCFAFGWNSVRQTGQKNLMGCSLLSSSSSRVVLLFPNRMNKTLLFDCLYPRCVDQFEQQMLRWSCIIKIIWSLWKKNRCQPLDDVLVIQFNIEKLIAWHGSFYRLPFVVRVLLSHCIEFS